MTPPLPKNQARAPARIVADIAEAWAILDRHATRACELRTTIAEAWAGAEDAVGFHQLVDVLTKMDRAADELWRELGDRYGRLPERQKERVGPWRKTSPPVVKQ
jgi:hypothetical protein